MKLDGFGKRLTSLRNSKNMTQKEFSELISVPQPTLSAYENDRISPTVDALINIADKCEVSIDWLCGRSSSGKISSMSQIVTALYDLAAINELKCEFEIHDRLPNDIEEPDASDPKDRWYTRMTFFGNDKSHKYNADICNIIKMVSEISLQLDYNQLKDEYFDYERQKWADYYTLPVSYKTYRELPLEEELEMRKAYLLGLEIPNKESK